VTLGSETAALSLREADSWRIRHVHGLPADLVNQRMHDTEERHAVLALESGEPVLVEDARTDSRVNQDHLRRHKIAAVLVAPLRVSDHPVGALFFNYHAGPHIFTDAEIAFARQLAMTASIALENAQLFEARRRAEDALRRLNHELDGRVQERTAELSRQAAKLRTLATELTLTEQRERRRLAEILHDEHQQLLVAAKLRLSLLQRGQATHVQTACEEVTALLQEAIEHSRALTQDLSPPILQIRTLLPALAWLAGWMEEKHQIKVDVDADPTEIQLSEEVTFLVIRCVRELLFNVVKHAQVLTAHLSATIQDSQVQIVISDRGVGFDPAQLLSRSSTSRGFGLFSIQEQLALFGGRLKITSAPGQGCRCTLWVPREVAESPEESDTRPTRRSSLTSKTPAIDAAGTKIRLVLADDHAVLRQSLARVLDEEPDLEVVGEAADGQTAVELARRLQPDLVLMDLSLPGLDGIGATRAIRTACPTVQVIGLSMYDDPEQARAMREAGAAHYLTKSSPTDALLAAIRGGKASAVK
jgi:signal transduction histidine kinase/CheY-like chemotaxis protein